MPFCLYDRGCCIYMYVGMAVWEKAPSSVLAGDLLEKSEAFSVEESTVGLGMGCHTSLPKRNIYRLQVMGQVFFKFTMKKENT